MTHLIVEMLLSHLKYGSKQYVHYKQIKPTIKLFELIIMMT